MTTNEILATARQHIASQSDADLLDMLTLSNDQAVTMWIATEIELRHPEISATLNAWAEDMDSTETQVEVIVRVLA